MADPPERKQKMAVSQALLSFIKRLPLRTLMGLGWLKGRVLSLENLLLEGTEARKARALALSDDEDQSPVVLDPAICLVPGKPVVRVEKAPGNARRIFTGIDIVSEEPDVLEVVWQTLSDYANLAKVVPNLVDNEVLGTTEDGGVRLRQVGGAKLAPGVVFRATTTVDVKTYHNGLPPAMQSPELPAMDSKAERAYSSELPLTKDIFPRPYCISSLPHRDITMQGVQEIRSDFRFYQGVWRMQRLPGCAPPGSSAMRLTYSVELSPSVWVPVVLLEGRIASALAENLEAIRDYVVATRPQRVGLAS